MDINNFIKDFPTTTENDLCEKYNITRSKVYYLKKKYNLLKNQEWLSNLKTEILTHRNKNINGRDLTNDLLKEIASTYNSKTEFYEMDNSAYITARKRGILKDITSHMKVKISSKPELILRNIFSTLFLVNFIENDRNAINPYELDLYFKDFNLAIEYNGRWWHKNDNVDKFKLCNDNNILLITIVENSRDYWKDIKNQLIINLDIINEKLRTDITDLDIVNHNEILKYPKLFTDDELYILRNNSKSFLIKNHKKLYNRYKKYNPDNLNFSNKIYTLEYVEEECKKYSNMSELYVNDKKLYQAIHKNFRFIIDRYNKMNIKKIICITDGNIFETLKEASSYYNINKRYISRVLSNERNETNGLKFKYDR